MNRKYFRLLLQHNYYDLTVPEAEVDNLDAMLCKTVKEVEESGLNDLILRLGMTGAELKFKARHLTGWVVKDTPFDDN